MARVQGLVHAARVTTMHRLACRGRAWLRVRAALDRDNAGSAEQLEASCDEPALGIARHFVPQYEPTEGDGFRDRQRPPIPCALDRRRRRGLLEPHESIPFPKIELERAA
jgi:hypothetical protein